MLVKRSDSLLDPRPSEKGYSLREAYRPRSSDELAQMLVSHPCPACGRVGGPLGRRWDSVPSSDELGPVLYSTVVHTCSCGLAMPTFIVLNDLLREGDHPCIGTAEALAQVDELLPPPDLERGLVDTRCLMHRGEEAEAVLMAEALLSRHSDRPECHFNAGCARQRLGDSAEAVAHYRACLSLHPQMAEAWLNRGVLLRQLGRLDEARFCFARARQAGAHFPDERSPRLLRKAAGAFDTLRVMEDEDLRALYIGGQCQGAMYLHADDDGPRPGTFPLSPFTTGWLLAGHRHPQGRGLMLGLGSGAGAVALLSNFPELHLCVVEIDGTLIDLALEYFPRLARLRRRGRLEIVHDDARDVVQRAYEQGPRSYDFALLDLFTGDQEPPPLLSEPGFGAALGACAQTVLANAIFTLGSDAHRRWLRTFEAAGRPIAALYPTCGPERWSTSPSNWILATERIDGVESFVPFEGSSYFVAQAIRDDFRSMCARVLVNENPNTECGAPPPECSRHATLGDASTVLA